ncbi:MAG: biosynthetic-type acetolactate synthase large subunit [Actinobacteria bacterium]|nr:biosynthetic-type acetolactate synthase large subunit [Actinomycetota bacterium]
MKAAEVIIRILEDEGITNAFGIPGAGINPVYKYLGMSKKIRHYLVRHEEAAVHAADGYFRASGKMAVALCTSGPGATNFITGIYTANIDSIPLIAITGQNVTSLLGKDAFQCVDIAGIAKPVAKAAWCITDPCDVPKIMRKAFKTAKEGKPGVVLIDLPLDVQMADIEYDPANDKSLPVSVVGPDPGKIKKAVELISQAKSPIIILGGGVILSDAVKECIEFAEYMQIPVITTYMAKGAIPDSHPLNAGCMGIQVGAPLGNKMFLDSDLVIGIGCRFSDRHTGNIDAYKGSRKFIHIDIEPKQIDKIIKADIGIVSDAKLALIALKEGAILKKAGANISSERVKSIPMLCKSLKRKTYYEDIPIKPQRVFYELNKFFGDNTMFTTGCGLNQIWSGQFQEINKPRMYLPSGGAGTLGFDIPAAIGAKIAMPENNVVAVMGDFGFTFMVEELAVAAKYNIPVIVVIINNAYLSLIRQNQKYAYQYEYAVEMKENQTIIDYVKVAEGFGCKGERVFKPEEISAAFERALKSGRPYVIDVIVENDTDCSMGASVDCIVEYE